MTETFPEVMVTGHRRLPKDALDGWLYRTVQDLMEKLVAEYGMERATSGLATGADTVWGQEAMVHELPLRAVIPYPEQPLDGIDGRFGPRWTKQQRADWERLKQYAEDTGGVTHVHEYNSRTPGQRVAMLHARNDWMLAHTQAVVAIWAPANVNTGTGSCLRKAARAGKPIILVNLANRAVTRPLPKHWAQYLNMPALAGR
jgi:hypothetical protein